MALRPSPNAARRDLGGAILGALAIVLGSAALGLLVNHFSPYGIPVVPRTEAARVPLPPGLTGITVEQAKAALEAGSTPFLDARDSAKYAAGHLPGAYHLPIAEFEPRFLDLADKLERAPQVVVYCDRADCGEAIELAERLKEAYQGQVLVFVDGWNAWVAAGYPVTKGETP